MQAIQAVRGMNDVLPDQSPLWEYFEQTVRDWLAGYGYRNMRMPVLEKTDLFVRSIGEVTDIVEKEMYTFVDQLNGESLTLRPEGTAGIMRARRDSTQSPVCRSVPRILLRTHVPPRKTSERSISTIPPGWS